MHSSSRVIPVRLIGRVVGIDAEALRLDEGARHNFNRVSAILFGSGERNFSACAT